MALIVPALINWLWQASLLTLAVALAVRVGPRVSASTRERIWWAALVANLALLAAAFSGEPASAIQPLAPSPQPLVPRIEPLIELPPLDRWPIAIAILWTAWIIVHLLRMTAGVVSVFRAMRDASPLVRHRGQPLDVPLVLSTAVRHAAVLGWRRPVIALAPATVARLSDRELDQVIVHELAHVRRRDPWALLVQRSIWTIAGFHPAMWWLDRAIALDRERACDDWVLAAGGSSKQYGACLLKLIAGPRGISLAPGAALTKGEMSKRIGYLLESGRDRSLRGSRTAMFATASVVAGLTVVCASHDLAAYQRVVAAMGLDITLVPGRAPSLWTLASSAAPSSNPGPVNRSPQAATGPNTTQRVEDADRPLETNTLGVQELVPLPPQPPQPIEARAVPGNLSVPDAIGSAPLNLSGDVPTTQTPEAAVSPQTPWQALADAGKAVGSGSRKAGVGTGRAFSRFGRSIAGVF